jgi:prolyl-tRNA synthetase
MLRVYRTFMEEWMAMPVVTGLKSDSERFAGALRTYACEALMQDNRALQAGTSHNLGQNFAKAFDVTFQTADGGIDHVWSTSWGVSTRLIGGLIMTHGDDRGLVCPPLLAQYQAVIVPIYKSDAERASVLEAAQRIRAALHAAGLRAHVDGREGIKPGAKYYEWEARGVPFRLEVGPRDVAAGQAMLARRTGGPKEGVALDGLPARLTEEVARMQQELFEAARARREANSLRGATRAQLLERMAGDGGGGFVYAGWCGSATCEAEIKAETRATIRVLPDVEFRSPEAPKQCVWCGGAATAEAVWAKAY